MLNINQCTLGSLYLLNCFLLFFFSHQDVWLYILGKEKAYDFCKSVALCLCRESETGMFSLSLPCTPLVSTAVTGGDLLDFHMKGIPHNLANVGLSEMEN